MAKSSAKTSAGPARVRLVILEAESPDGDLSQVMQAAQNALRPADNVTVMRRAIAAPPKGASSAEVVDVPPMEETAEVEQEEQASSPSTGRTRRAKPRSPKVIPLDLKSGEVPFAAFAQSKRPTTHAARNLVVAAWFKLHRVTDEINMDHVYTCYREVNWPTGMEDFGLTLRQLKGRKVMDGKGAGLYAINHIGLNDVSKMGSP